MFHEKLNKLDQQQFSRACCIFAQKQIPTKNYGPKIYRLRMPFIDHQNNVIY